MVAGFLLLILPGGVGVREAFLARLMVPYLQDLGATGGRRHGLGQCVFAPFGVDRVGAGDFWYPICFEAAIVAAGGRFGFVHACGKLSPEIRAPLRRFRKQRMVDTPSSPTYMLESPDCVAVGRCRPAKSHLHRRFNRYPFFTSETRQRCFPS